MTLSSSVLIQTQRGDTPLNRASSDNSLASSLITTPSTPSNSPRTILTEAPTLHSTTLLRSGSGRRSSSARRFRHTSLTSMRTTCSRGKSVSKDCCQPARRPTLWVFGADQYQLPVVGVAVADGWLVGWLVGWCRTCGAGQVCNFFFGGV